MRASDSTTFDCVIIGAGLGGLASALRLQQAGLRVCLLEKNETPGGKLGEFKSGGCRWDMGPSLLTMPYLLDRLFADLGLHRGDHLRLHRVHPVCRYFWDDGTLLDEDEAFFRKPEVRSFLEYARGIHELAGEAFLRYPPDEFGKAFTAANWPKLKHLPKVATFRSLAVEVDRRFSDPRLRQLFQRFSTYNGSHPWKTPATFNIIPYIEAEYGGWYVDGGMARLPECLAGLALQRGIPILTGAEVIHCSGEGVQLRDGRWFRSMTYLVNGDVIRAHRDWIRFPGSHRKARRLLAKELSLSALVYFFHVTKRFSFLKHHNIFFSNDYEREFQELFELKKLPEDPTLYISITARTNPAHAPEGHDNFFVLVNAPAETERIDWKTEGLRYAEHVLKRLERHGLGNLSEHAKLAGLFTPRDFADRHVTCHGSLYGWASHSPRTALFRPPLQSSLDPRLFFTGGTTHPGGGIPLVLLSAEMASGKILDYIKTA